MKVPFVDLKAQYSAIADEIQPAMQAVLERGDFILGGDVSLFEEEFAAYCGARHAVALDTGTSALELALQALGIGPGAEVITTANTFIATALAISYTGARPVLVDVDPRTYNMDPARVEAAITGSTRAIIPVHLYGQPADMEPLLEIARRRDLVVIEDACQAHGARYHGRRVGSIGQAAAFSFYPAKNLGAYGDGGMLVTDDERVAARVRMLRDYGQSKKYEHVVRGYNRRLDTLQAAVLRVKLRHLDAWNDARRQHAKLYDQLLQGLPVTTPAVVGDVLPVYHLYVIRVQERDRLRAYLSSRGISTGIHYPVPIHLQEAYRDLGHARGAFPLTEQYADEVLSLPMYAELGADQAAYVAEAISDFVGG